MKILHYFLGFPPFRSGGLTKFACDLMSAQAERGNSVIALWPGKMDFFGKKKVSIKSHENYGRLRNYELINPLPVPLDEGIKDIPEFTKSCDISVFVDFLEQIRPDVIHIHTLMGLYIEFIDAACSLNIRTIYTSHDNFGICPKVTLFRNGSVCDCMDCSKCVACNSSALSINKIRLLQSPVYKKIKNLAIVKKLRGRHRMSFFMENAEIDSPAVFSDLHSEDYEALRSYYMHMLLKIDCIHFNSSLIESVYKRFMEPKQSRLISITHKNIFDNRGKAAEFPASSKLRLTYMAAAHPGKGYLIIKKALDELWQEGFRSFELKMFCTVANPSPYMKMEPAFSSYKMLESIFANTDVLLAPSVWFETFGFTALEALSFGIPVIVSSNVGAKDVVGGGGIVVEPGSVDSLKDAVKSLTPQKLCSLKEEVQKSCKIKTWDEFLQEMDLLYKNKD